MVAIKLQRSKQTFSGARKSNLTHCPPDGVDRRGHGPLLRGDDLVHQDWTNDAGRGDGEAAQGAGHDVERVAGKDKLFLLQGCVSEMLYLCANAPATVAAIIPACAAIAIHFRPHLSDARPKMGWPRFMNRQQRERVKGTSQALEE